MRHARCSACTIQGHNRQGCPRLHGPRAPARLHPAHTETHALREAIWEQLSFRFPKTPYELFAEIRADWGEIEERRLWNALQWNRERRRIRRVTVERELPWSRRGVERTVEKRTPAYLRAA